MLCVFCDRWPPRTLNAVNPSSNIQHGIHDPHKCAREFPLATKLLITRLRLFGQRVWPQLKVNDHRFLTLAALDMPVGNGSVGCPEPATLPSRPGIVNASVQSPCVETHRI